MSTTVTPHAPSTRLTFPGGQPRTSPKGWRGAEQKYVLLGLVLFAIYSVAPVWWLLVNVTKDRRDLYQSNGLWFANWSLGTNLSQLVHFEDGIFFRWLGNTLFYALGGALVCTAISIACGYALSRFTFRGRGLGLAIVIGCFLIPTPLITVPLYLLFAKVGLVDTVWAVLIPFFVSPFGVYLAKVYADATVPEELLEAARIDGASELRIFGQIVVPLMSTGAATVFILLFVQNWNNFFLPLTMLRGQEKFTLAVGLYNWFSQKNDSVADHTTLVLTGAVISVIPLAVIMISMQRYWRTGVAMGALK